MDDETEGYLSKLCKSSPLGEASDPCGEQRSQRLNSEANDSVSPEVQHHEVAESEHSNTGLVRRLNISVNDPVLQVANGNSVVTSTASALMESTPEVGMGAKCQPTTACNGMVRNVENQSNSEGRWSRSITTNKALCQTSITDLGQDSMAIATMEGHIPTDLSCSPITKQDGAYQCSPQAEGVTLNDARLGLLKVITYLECHPIIGSDFLPQLCQLLNLLEEYGRKLVCDGAAHSSCVREDELQLCMRQILKQRIEKEEVLDEGVHRKDVQEKVDDTVAFKNGHVYQVSDACGLSLKCDQTIQKHAKHGVWTKRTKSKQTCAKINVLKTLIEEESNNNSDEINEMLTNDESSMAESPSEQVASCSSETKDTVETKCDLKQQRKRTKNGVFLSCNFCGKQFKNPSHLKEHSLVHADKKPYKCDTCGKGFSRQSYVKQHQMLHTGEKPFRCTSCNKGFRSSSQMKQHRTVHTGEKPFKCSRCSARFAYAAGLKSHIRTHTGDRPFTCTMCGAQLAHAGSLKVHMMRLHTRERPFICASCGKAFTTSADLETHQRTHTGERPYACTACGKRFSQCGQLKTHMRTHTGEKPYLCAMCGKGFAHTSSLSVHMRGHTGERPYQCTLCDMRCSDSTNLKKHMRLHTNENLYRCTICGQNFAQLNSLSKHMSTHMPPDSERYQTHSNTSMQQTVLHYENHVQHVRSFMDLNTHVYPSSSETSVNL